MAEPVDPASTEPSPEETQRAARTRSQIWIWVLLIVGLNGLLFLKTCANSPRELSDAVADAAGRTIEKAGQALATVVAAFNGGRVTTEFISYASSIQPTHRLQFATVKQTEIFTRRDEKTTAFGYLPLPEVIVEARAPVEFTYYLDFNAPWKLVLQDNVIYVLAPSIQFNQPSIDVSAIQYEVRKGSVFRNTTEALDGLKQSITGLARTKARENVGLVRETGRRQTAEFVEKWLSRQFSDGRNFPVKVYFAGETLPPALAAAPLGVSQSSPESPVEPKP